MKLHIEILTPQLIEQISISKMYSS